MQELTLLRDKKIAQVTSIILGLFLFVTVALLAYQFYLRAKLNSVQAASADETRKIQGLAAVQNTYATVSKKIKTVASIFAKRGNKWDAITFFYGILPAGASINSVNLQASTAGNELSFALQAPNVFAYDQLSAVIQSDRVLASGYSLDLGSLSRAKDGSYRVEVNLKTATVPKPTPRTTPTPAP